MNRWASLLDLNNYFKKKDLLGGLTDLEKKQLKQNLDIIENSGDGGRNKPIDIEAINLQNLIRANSLVTGVRYRIIDFQTMYKLEDKVYGSDSENWHLITIANSTNILDSRVTIEEHPDWIVEYDPTPVLLLDDLYNKGTITYLKDSNNNEAYYDFKNIKFLRDGLMYFTFSDIVNGLIVDSSELHNTANNVIANNSYNNVFIGDTYNNIILPGCSNNTFYKGCHNSTLGWDSVNNVFKEAVRFTSGSIYNKTFNEGNTSLSTTITKTIQKVNEVDLISFLDPITFSHQIIII